MGLICHPRSIMGAFTSIGVMINGAPSFDLGSNESWTIDLPPQAIQQFKFVIPRDKSFDLRIPSSPQKTYVLFAVTLDQFYIVAAVHKYQAKVVDEATFNKECSSPKQNYLKHNAL